MSQNHQQKRPSYGSMRGNSAKMLFEEFGNQDLGDIQENEELHAPLTTESSYLLTNLNDDTDNDNTDNDDDSDDASDGSDYDDIEQHLSSISKEGFHLGAVAALSARNVMVHERRTSSFLALRDDYELVPTQLKNNVRMVEDVNLIDNAKGRLYLARYSFFNNCHDLKFALTVQPDIYERIVSEVSDSFTMPCGLFFCCHGGDGAHTGVSHNDYVDIKLAWFFFLMVLGIMLAIDSLVD